MKAIDVAYIVRMGYWALKNNVQENKIYHNDTNLQLGFCEQLAKSS